MSARVSAEDLRWAAMWLEAYNDGEDTDDNGDPEPMVPGARRVAAKLLAEADQRDREARVGRLAKQIAARLGRKPSDPAVRAKAKELA